MVKNNKLLETLFKCTKENKTKGECKGCFYGDGTNAPSCMLNMMNDILFFFNNPVPDPYAKIIPLEELEEILSDKKDHLAFAEFISTIHVAMPVIRSISMSRNVITLYDPTTNEKDQFIKDEYYAKFRVWSSKPTDSLRNTTPWIPIDGQLYDDIPQEKASKTTDILRYVNSMVSNKPSL